MKQELNEKQVKAVIALEKALKQCDNANVYLYGMHNHITAYNGNRLQSAFDKGLVDEGRNNIGEEFPSYRVHDFGSYKDSGADDLFRYEKMKEGK